MIEEWIGRLGWPAVVAVIVIVAALFGADFTNDANRHDLQVTIVEKCATQPNPVACTEQMTKAVSKVK